ncbi:hypothetical protein B9Z19DRAFT_1071702 [Tuber borchii]|uniref:Uncharacterized protein n=1 Tax=Tuber borchii TaxID=42251 RepID=A0A2T7A7Y1_TUBBO|nr:hypothetical protein B9Z19DRAFT_1071702 [Tuber borchii]
MGGVEKWVKWGNVEERLRGGMAGVENVEEWSKRRNGWGEGGGRFEVWLGGEGGGMVKRRDGWSGECGGMVKEEEGLEGGTVGVENLEEWSKRRNGWSGEMDGAAGEL